MDQSYLHQSTEARSRNIMPNRRNHRKEVEKAVMDALHQGPETINLVSLDQEEDPERLIQLTQQYHQWLCRQSQSTDAKIRFHQGQVRTLYRQKGSYESTLTKFEKDIADKTYALFLGYEWLLDGFYGHTRDIVKLTYHDITQIRNSISENIQRLFKSLRDETSSVDTPDVTVYPEIV